MSGALALTVVHANGVRSDQGRRRNRYGHRTRPGPVPEDGDRQGRLRLGRGHVSGLDGHERAGPGTQPVDRDRWRSRFAIPVWDRPRRA